MSLFDPTIYENMKIIIEGAVYDLDLAGDILVTNRLDRVELSTMSRSFTIQFRLLGGGEIFAEISLTASTADLASEILEKSTITPGCSFAISYSLPVFNLELECASIQQLLQDIWGSTCSITQKLSFYYGNQKRQGYHDQVYLDFGRRFGESIHQEIASLLEHILESLQQLNAVSSDL